MPPNPGNWADQGYDTIAVGGVPLATQRTTLNVVGVSINVAVADNPGTEQTDLTLTLPAAAPTPPAATVTGTSSIAAPTQDVTIPFDASGGDVSLTFTGTPAPGVRARFVDVTKSLGTHNCTLHGQGSSVIQDPANLAGANAASMTAGPANPNGFVVGGSFTIQWFPDVGAGGSWLSA